MSILIEEEYWVSTQNNKPSLNLIRKTFQVEQIGKPQLAFTEGFAMTRGGQALANLELQ